ncbi:MAG: hypothetical protein DI591_02340 [Citromicrobium sp.]|nr:MAG: hypothetical protein DI591_02340 [Citromicrobium sp.]
MHEWHYYVVMGICLVVAFGLQTLAVRNPEFPSYSPAKRFFTRLFSFVPPAFFIFLPYTIWAHSGFQPADARNAEGMMVQQYLDDGTQRAEAHFIVKDRDTMAGLVDVTFADGSLSSVQCKADMGEDGQFLVSCS